MPIPESQLDTWSHLGSVVQSRDTYATVKRALEATDTKYAANDFAVFLQGSYGNDTNIYAESDVDVVMRLDSIYYYDTSGLIPDELKAFNSGFCPATYSYPSYKAHVIEALQKSFGTAVVTPGSKAVKIAGSGARRSADVIVAAEFRQYYSAPIVAQTLGPQYQQGICFFTPRGRIENFPKQHSANCTAKHQATSGYFKPMVRVLKNMRSRLVADGKIPQGNAPSYFLENLLYNVPSEKFGTSYADTFVAAMNWILQADRTQLLCANQTHYLVRDCFAECWPSANCHGFIDAAVELWNNWR